MTNNQPININLIVVTIGCFLTYALLSGLLSQVGTLSAAMSAHFSKPVTETASQFSYFSTGITVGSLLSLFAYEYLSIKRALLVCYVIFTLSLSCLCILDNWSSLPALLAISGLTASLGLNTAAVVISLNYQHQQRAIMLLCTDICFAGAGILASPSAVMLIENGFPWHASFWFLCGISVVIILIVSISNYPQTAKESQKQITFQRWPITSFLCALSLFCYIFAQMTMLIWLPNFINRELGEGFNAGANAISQYWTGMLVGQIILAFALVRFPTRLLLTMISIASVFVSTSLWAFDIPKQLHYAALALGLVNAGILKLTISYAAEFIVHPQRVVTFLLFTAACGQALSPVVSAELVKLFDIYFGLQLVSVFMLLAALFISAAIGLAPTQTKIHHHATSST